VSLARLRLSPATLWVLDEPFTTLDVDAVAQLELTLAEHAERGGGVIVTTHHTLSMPGLTRLTLGVS
jgi:heme exporter protein A